MKNFILRIHTLKLTPKAIKKLNKTICIILSFIMLFNISAQALGPSMASVEVEKELKTALQDAYNTNQPSSDIEKNWQFCSKQHEKTSCRSYIDSISEMFIDTRDSIEDGEEVKEEKEEQPISQREYNKELQENTQNEYEKNIKSIENAFKIKKRTLDFKYQNIPFGSTENQYPLEMQRLNDWKQENLKAVNSWKNETLNNKQKYYEQYLKEFEKSKAEYKEELEKAKNEFLQEIAANMAEMLVNKKTKTTNGTISYYNFDSEYIDKIVNVIIMLLSMESDDVKFFNSQEKQDIFNYFKNQLTKNACKFHDVRNMSDWEAEKLVQSVRNTAAQRQENLRSSVGYDSMHKQYLTIHLPQAIDAGYGTHPELINPQACQSAMTALKGLAFFKKYNMNAVMNFMISHLEEPTSAEILLLGTDTLLQTNNTYLLEVVFYKTAEISQTFAHDDEDEGGENLDLKESMVFDDRYYRSPFQYSRWSKENGGGDVWQDIAEIFSNYRKENPKDYVIKQVLDKVVDLSVNVRVSGNSEVLASDITFTHNIPFIYGILLYHPDIFDNFVPRAATVGGHGMGYRYRGRTVHFTYLTDKVKMYIIDEEKGIIYINDSDTIEEMLSDGDRLYEVEKKAGDIRKREYEKYKNNLSNKQQKYRESISKKNLEPSAVFAEVFYKQDFVDLTTEEKLAMDRALEKKYPHLKKYSPKHKDKLENHRTALVVIDVSAMVIDIALTVWCVADVYKLAKLGIKSIKAIRGLIKAGKIASNLAPARKARFLRTLLKKHPNIIKANKKIKQIKSIPARITNKYPSYSVGVPLQRLSHNGERVLTITKLDGTSVSIGKNVETVVKETPVKPKMPTLEQEGISKTVVRFESKDSLTNKAIKAQTKEKVNQKLMNRWYNYNPSTTSGDKSFVEHLNKGELAPVGNITKKEIATPAEDIQKYVDDIINSYKEKGAIIYEEDLRKIIYNEKKAGGLLEKVVVPKKLTDNQTWGNFYTNLKEAMRCGDKNAIEFYNQYLSKILEPSDMIVFKEMNIPGMNPNYETAMSIEKAIAAQSDKRIIILDENYGLKVVNPHKEKVGENIYKLITGDVKCVFERQEAGGQLREFVVLNWNEKNIPNAIVLEVDNLKGVNVVVTNYEASSSNRIIKELNKTVKDANGVSRYAYRQALYIDEESAKILKTLRTPTTRNNHP